MATGGSLQRGTASPGPGTGAAGRGFAFRSGVAFNFSSIVAVGRLSVWCAALVLPSAAGAEEPDLEQIVVTGSRIARPDFESASPIVSIDQDAFERAASSTVDTALNRMPQFVAQYTNTSNNPGDWGRATVQLRGLGGESTLVLVNGRRLVPADSTGVVDANIVPASLIASAEIITGGASAVYGSDAIAGVVNFKLKPEFNGLQLDGRWGQTDRSDAADYAVGVTAGTKFASGRGQVYGYLGYAKRDDVLNADRSFASVPLGYFGAEAGFVPEGSPSIAQGRPSIPLDSSSARAAFAELFESYGYVVCQDEDATGCVPYQSNFGVNQDGTLFTQGDGRAGSVANFLGGDQGTGLYTDRLYTYNYAPYNYLQMPLQRISIFGRATYRLDDETELFGEALLVDYSTDQRLAPTPAYNIRVPRSNPYISPDLGFLLDARPDPSAPFQVAKRLEELGPRFSSNENKVYQLTAGLNRPLRGSWALGAYAQFGQTRSREKQFGNALRSRMEELAAAPDGGQSVCGEFNLFEIGGISADCAKYVSVTAENRTGYEQAIVEATATGTLLALPAGALQLAIGAMYKSDESYYDGDPVGAVVLDDEDVDIQGFSASDDVEGSDSNVDVFVEALVPLLAGRPGAERLEIGLGYRHSQYQSAGGTDSWKLDLLYQPANSLRLRGSFQHAVRAPSVQELYLPLLPTGYEDDPADPSTWDPCTSGSPYREDPATIEQVLRLCVQQGVPTDQLSDFQAADFWTGVYGGNPDLKPESADTYTIGLVLNPQFENPQLGRVQVSLDWYQMNVQDSIEFAAANEYVFWCYGASTNPQFELSNRWCQFFSRDPDTGDIDGLRDIYINKEGYDVSGIDAQVDWRLPLASGELGVNLLASWLESFNTVPPPGVQGTDQAGYIGGLIGTSYPAWKFILDVRYDVGSLGVGGEWRYISSMLSRDTRWNFRVPSQSYLGLFAIYAMPPGILDGLTLRGGLDNLTDEDPPLFPDWIQANTDPSQYDVLGRRYYLEMVYRF
jgi:iron complex outermembrane recepter protein